MSISIISKEIVEQAQNGDMEAYNKIYKAYYNKVYFTGMQFFHNREMSKDIVQEVFIKVYKNLRKLKEPNAIGVWIHRIAYNECVNYSRKSKINIVDLGDSYSVDDFADEKDMPISDKINQKKVKETIYESLNTMSEPLKIAGFLRYHEEYKIEEIVEILSIPKGTVNSRLSRVRKILQADLTEKGLAPKNYGIIAFAPGILKSAYEMLYNQYLLNEKSSDEIYNSILNSIVVVGSGVSLVTKIISSIIIATSAIGVGYGIYQHTMEEEYVNLDINTNDIAFDFTSESLAKISNIEYETGWMSKELNLNVITTNKNYDKILVNDMETLQIATNGSHIVKLIKDEKVIDQQEVYISNIDVEGPTGYSVQTEDNFVLYVVDQLSGVNPHSIAHYRNGALVNDYVYDETIGAIIVTSGADDMEVFYIYDYAGNLLEININKNEN